MSVEPDDYQSYTLDETKIIQSASRQQCGLSHSVKDTSYPGCCRFSCNENQHDVISERPLRNGFATNETDDDIIDFALNLSAQASDDEKLEEKRDRIPMCIHGVHYHLERISKSLFTETELILETLPLRQLNEFAEAFRNLIASVEDLRFCHLTQT